MKQTVNNTNFINNKNSSNWISIEKYCNLNSNNIVEDLHFLTGRDPLRNFYKWPIKGFKNSKIKNISGCELSYIN